MLLNVAACLLSGECPGLLMLFFMTICGSKPLQCSKIFGYYLSIFVRMEVQIRPALEHEIDTLLEFEQGIVAAERPFDNTLKEGEIHYYDLLELIQSPTAEVLVAVIGDELVGSGYAKIVSAKAYQKYELYAHLGFMYVSPEHRGQGINKLILEALLRWARDRNITEVRLEVYDQNESAKKAYSKAGFKPNLLEMRMEL